MTTKIHIPTFDADVIFMFDVGRETVRKYLKRKFFVEVEKLDTEFAGLTVDVGNMTWFVYVPDTEYDDLIWLVRTLSHEANHVVLQMMDLIGVHDDETICYSQDNLLGQMLEGVLRRKVKPKGDVPRKDNPKGDNPEKEKPGSKNPKSRNSRK